MNDTALIVISAMFGLALCLFVYGLREAILSRYYADVAWAEATAYRFSPERYDASRKIAMFYIALAVLLGLNVLFFPAPLVGVVFIVVLFFVPRMYVESAWRKRRALIDSQLPQAVAQMASSVASGMTLPQALERLADRADMPIRTEFRIMNNQWRAGSDLPSTIEEAKRRLALPNFNLFASALLVNQKMGGNVVQTLESLARSLESIDRMRREVYAATSEGRMNIKVLVLAPFIMLGLSYIIVPDGVKLMFTTDTGWIAVGLAVALTAAGALWGWKIVNADV
ncbi:MAG: type II secretion system F family protein [Phycisphaerales bacterium]|nr:type II secretion system F family protein [Phycisphaerales bacterium]